MQFAFLLAPDQQTFGFDADLIRRCFVVVVVGYRCCRVGGELVRSLAWPAHPLTHSLMNGLSTTTSASQRRRRRRRSGIGACGRSMSALRRCIALGGAVVAMRGITSGGGSSLFASASCPPQTQIEGSPDCDELLVRLNDTAGCSHLEYAFGFNCSGCACDWPTQPVDSATTTSGLANNTQFMAAIWTFVAALVVVIGIVVATFCHKLHAKDVVLPENEQRPLSQAELAKVRRAKLRMQTRRFSRTMDSILPASSLTKMTASQRALVEVGSRWRRCLSVVGVEAFVDKRRCVGACADAGAEL